jgi:hypothetical protein
MQTVFPLGVSTEQFIEQQSAGLVQDPPLAMQLLPASGVVGVTQKLPLQVVPAQQVSPQAPPHEPPAVMQLELVPGLTQQNMSEPASPWLCPASTQMLG